MQYCHGHKELPTLIALLVLPQVLPRENTPHAQIYSRFHMAFGRLQGSLLATERVGFRGHGSLPCAHWFICHRVHLLN